MVTTDPDRPADPWWLFRAMPDPFSDHPRGVVDGDTLDVVIDHGMCVLSRTRLRLVGVDTAEVYGVAADSEEFAAGLDHSEFVHDWLTTAATGEETWPLTVRTYRDRTGKYGRFLTDVVRRRDGADLARAIRRAYPSTAPRSTTDP